MRGDDQRFKSHRVLMFFFLFSFLFSVFFLLSSFFFFFFLFSFSIQMWQSFHKTYAPLTRHFDEEDNPPLTGKNQMVIILPSVCNSLSLSLFSSSSSLLSSPLLFSSLTLSRLHALVEDITKGGRGRFKLPTRKYKSFYVTFSSMFLHLIYIYFIKHNQTLKKKRNEKK